MKTLLITTIIVSGLMTIAPSFAGNSSGGGGQGIVCRNDDGTVSSAQLLDLAEAENFFLLNLQGQSQERSYLEIAHEYAAILDSAIPSTIPTSKLTTTLGNLPPQVNYDINVSVLSSKQNHNSFISLAVDRIDAEKKLIPGNNFSIPPVGDSQPRVIPSAKNCKLEQIAVYRDGDNQVHIVGNVWNQLSNVNKAALLIHEALYRDLRVMGDSSSDRTRKAVAYLFSGMKFEWILNGLPETYLFCWTNDSETSFQFAVYPNENSKATALFLVYDGEIMLSRTAANLNMAPFASIFNLPNSPENNQSVINRIKNPLVDVPTYHFAVEVDRSSGKMTSSIEAVTLMGGKNLKQVSCQKKLSSITYGDDGSITVSPASL